MEAQGRDLQVKRYKNRAPNKLLGKIPSVIALRSLVAIRDFLGANRDSITLLGNNKKTLERVYHL